MKIAIVSRFCDKDIHTEAIYAWIGEGLPSRHFSDYAWHTTTLKLNKKDIEKASRRTVFQKEKKETGPIGLIARHNYELFRQGATDLLSMYHWVEISDEELLTSEDSRLRRWAAQQLTPELT